MDNDRQIFFYEHDYYVFSNFSSFKLNWKGYDWMTSEHAYHSEKFINNPEIIEELKQTRSAHDALKFSEKYNDQRRGDWDEVKLGIMEEILKQKVLQHPYVMKKLKESGDRELIEDSWRDNFWGWGPNKDGENNLGKIWMKVRSDFSREGLI